MLREIISEALAVIGGENYPSGMPDHIKECDGTGGAFLADELIRLIQEGTLTWGISGERDLLVCVTEGFILIVRKMRDGPGGYGYILSVFEDGQEILSEESAPQRSYNTHSPRLPIMDLFDVVVDGRKRPVPPAHVCGLQGFGMGLGDRCSACEAARGDN